MLEGELEAVAAGREPARGDEGDRPPHLVELGCALEGEVASVHLAVGEARVGERWGASEIESSDEYGREYGAGSAASECQFAPLVRSRISASAIDVTPL